MGLLSDGYTESIVVLTSIIWAVQHNINLEEILIQIAVHMINMAALQVSSSPHHLPKSKILHL